MLQQFLVILHKYMLGYALPGTPNVSLHQSDISLMPWVRSYVAGCGFKSKLVQLLLQQRGHNLDVQMCRSDSNKMIHTIVCRVAAGLATAVRKETAKKAEELCAIGQCKSALVPLQFAIYLGDLPSRALMAWLLIVGREGVAQDHHEAFKLAEEGASLGCHHSQGVMAWCYRWGHGCEGDEAQSLELARKSSGKGSRYGQDVLGWLYYDGVGGVAQDYAQAVALYQLSAAQGLDWAQYTLGFMYDCSIGVAQDLTEALRWYRLAAAQGHHQALYQLARCYEKGSGVRRNKTEAIRLYRCARNAGNRHAAEALQELR
jgi:TPR repeat protein